MYRETERDVKLMRTLTSLVRLCSIWSGEDRANNTDYTAAVRIEYRSARRHVEVQTRLLRLTFASGNFEAFLAKTELIKYFLAQQNGNTHQPPSMKVNVINHFFLLDDWIRHTKGMGSAKVRKSVAIVIIPKAKTLSA